MAIQDNKIVSLVALKRYNHDLITRLGLTNDTAAYANLTTKGATGGIDVFVDGWTKATNVKQALDQLYDLVSKTSSANLNQATVSDANNVATVSLQNKQGDTTTDLASFGVKSPDANLAVTSTATDVVLDVKSVSADKTDGTGTVTGDTDAADALTQKSYVDNAIAKAETDTAVSYASGKSDAATATTATFTQDGATKKYYVNVTVGSDVYNIELNGTDFLKDGFLETVTYNSTDKTIDFTWNTDAGKKATSIKASDLLGNLTGGDGIDITNGVISVDLAEAGNEPVQLKFTDGKLDVETITGTVTKSGTGTWVADEANGISTAQNVADVANDLQGQIDALGNAHTVVDAKNAGTTATATDAVYVTSAANVDNGTTYTVNYATCVDSDIDAIFGV